MIESITFETVTLKPSSTSVVEAGSTVEDVPVSPVLEEALTVKLGKSWPEFTKSAPASVNVIFPVEHLLHSLLYQRL